MHARDALLIPKCPSVCLTVTCSELDYYSLLAAVLMCRKLCTIAAETVVSVVQRQFSFLLFFCNNTEDIKGKPHGFSNLAHLWQMFWGPSAMLSRLLYCSLCSYFLFCSGANAASVPFVLYFSVDFVELFWNELQTHICFCFASPSCLCVTSCTIANLN